MCMCVCVYVCKMTSEQLFDLPAGLGGGKLVNDVQGRLTQRVPHPSTDATLDTGGQEKKVKEERSRHTYCVIE